MCAGDLAIFLVVAVAPMKGVNLQALSHKNEIPVLQAFMPKCSICSSPRGE